MNDVSTSRISLSLSLPPFLFLCLDPDRRTANSIWFYAAGYVYTDAQERAIRRRRERIVRSAAHSPVNTKSKFGDIDMYRRKREKEREGERFAAENLPADSRLYMARLLIARFERAERNSGHSGVGDGECARAKAKDFCDLAVLGARARIEIKGRAACELCAPE